MKIKPLHQTGRFSSKVRELHLLCFDNCMKKTVLPLMLFDHKVGKKTKPGEQMGLKSPKQGGDCGGHFGPKGSLKGSLRLFYLWWWSHYDGLLSLLSLHFEGKNEMAVNSLSREQQGNKRNTGLHCVGDDIVYLRKSWLMLVRGF